MRYKRWHKVLILVMTLANGLGLIVNSQPVAKDGVLDLRTYSFMDDGIIKLNGEWEFYWNQLIDPLSPIIGSPEMVPVPMAWKDMESYVSGIEEYGYGSYRLKILLPEDVRNLSFSFRKVVGGSGYYVNGKNIGYQGFPGTNRYQYEFDLRPSQQLAAIKDSIVSLVIHVSNFDHHFGGITGAVELGFPTQIYALQSERLKQNYFILGAFLLIGLYFFMQFFIISDKYKLYFSMICFGMVFWMLLLLGPDIKIVGNLDGKDALRLEDFGFAFIVPFFILLLKEEFKYDFPSVIIKINLWISILIIGLIVFSPMSLYSKLMPVFLIYVSIAGVYVFVVLVIAIIRGRKFAMAYLFGLLMAFGGAFYDGLILMDKISGELISHFTMFSFLLISTMIYAAKSNFIVKKSDLLSKEIIAMNENLETIVDNRTKELKEKSKALIENQIELEASNEKLQKLLDHRSRFFTIIGHDIRGPIGANTQMLELLSSGHFEEEQKGEMMKLLMESSKATQSLVENLLVWGRAQTNELVVHTEILDIHLFVSEVCDLFALSFREKGVKISNEIAEETFVHCDKQHMQLLLRNLIWNALKFSSEGGIVSIYSEKNRDTGEVAIVVKDRGVGIPQSTLVNLFSEGDLISTVGTKREKGTGIGLKLCKEIVEANGGSIHLESKVGEGTSVRVSLLAGA